jgi:hypothetical protein
MPRRSIEDIAAAAYRCGGKPPAPPKCMGKRAKAIFTAIAGSRPPDYFCPAGQIPLASFCELQTVQEINLQMLRDEPTNPQWQKLAAQMQQQLNALAVKLKISPSGNLKRNAGIINERAPITDDEDNIILFGGGGGQTQW